MSTAHMYPQKGMPGNAAFHPTIQTVGFQTAFSVITLSPYFVNADPET
jgi:hypothetical protein